MKGRFVFWPGLGTLFFCSVAHADPTFPTRPVRFIVPFPAGGGADVVGRVVGMKLEQKWGLQVVVDNRAGAGGNIAAEIAAAAPADGHTMFQFNVANTIAVGLYKKLNYDPVRDFSALSMLGTSPFILFVHPAVKATTVAELVSLAKAEPGHLRYASSGNGGPSHLAAELLKIMTNIELIHVPYKGVSPSMNDLLSGQVQLTFAVPGSGLPHAKAGRIRAIAVSAAKRTPLAPDLPTIAESGVAGYDAITWYAAVVPTGTPNGIVTKINKDLVQVLADPQTRDRLMAIGVEVASSTPEQLSQWIINEVAKWRRLVKFSGAQVD